MRTQKILATVVLACSAVAFNASAAIVNQIDFPAEFVHAKEKVNTQHAEQTPATDVQN